MKIVIRDEGGYVAYEVAEEYGFEFADGYVWWTDVCDDDHKTPIENLVRIINENTI